MDIVLTILFLGAVPLCIGLWQLFREVAPHKWPQVDGTIVNSTIKKQLVQAGGYQYIPLIDYEYSYEGKNYSSSKWRVGNYATGSSEDAEVIHSRYPIGGKVKVFVDPENSYNSVLEFGTTPLSWVCIVLGLFVTAALGGAALMGH